MYGRTLFIFAVFTAVIIMATKDQSVYDKTKNTLDDAHKTVSDKTNSAFEGTKDAANKVSESVKGAAQGLADSKPGQSVKEGVHKVGEALSNSAS